jgi:hypothetical protein
LKVFSSIAILALAISLGQSVPSADVKQLERLEIVWNEAHERGNADALDALWADDLEVAVPKMPVMKKTDVLSFVRSARMKFLQYATSDLRVRVYERRSRRNRTPPANTHFER